MAVRAPWAGFTRDSQTVAAGASVTFPSVSIPSIPFLDETNRSAAFDVVNVMAAAQVGTVAANWALTAAVQFQPMKQGPSASLALTVTALALLQQVTSAPGMTLTITATNNGAAPDTISIAYGGVAAPGLTHEDGGAEGMPPTYRAGLIR